MTLKFPKNFNYSKNNSCIISKILKLLKRRSQHKKANSFVTFSPNYQHIKEHTKPKKKLIIFFRFQKKK